MRQRLAAWASVLLLASAAAAQEPDFTVRFDAEAVPVAPGLLFGMNDINNASPGVWKAWAESVHPHDGLIRVWLKYHLGQLNETHFRTCQEAKDAGFGIFLTIVGKPGVRADQRAGEILTAPDPKVFAQQAARDVARLLEKGLPIRYIEIWNEPDMPENWEDSDETFATFFAQAGAQLRPLVDAKIKIGGPGMAASYGGGLRLFKLLTAACKASGWRPDFLSWHDYSGLPMDQLYHNTARRVTEMARADGLGAPELILSEWNCGLPGRSKPYPALDDHRGAAVFVSMATALAQTPVTHSLFFMLQDGSWDTNVDFGGFGVGVFTLHGAPKALLAAMRMVARVCALPRVPVTPRERLPANFSLLATRSGSRGYLMAASVVGGKTEEHARKLVEAGGVDLSSLNGKEDVIQRYAKGDLPYERTGLPAQDRAVWERAVAEMRALAQEARQTDRRITVRMNGAPARLIGAWVIDERHGNPIADADLRKQFKPFEGGWYPAAAQMTLQQLRGEGVPEDQVKIIEAAFRDKRHGAMSGVPAETAARAKTIFESMQDRVLNEVPRELARHPAAAAAKVPVRDWAQLEGDLLTLRLPPFTSLMLEVSWDPQAHEDEQ